MCPRCLHVVVSTARAVLLCLLSNTQRAQFHTSFPQVKGLSKRLANIERLLKDNVLDDFSMLMGTADVKVRPAA